jgi:uncharacterized membrane protein YhaH (DUF805 family)
MSRITRTEFTIRLILLISADFLLYAIIDDKISSVIEDKLYMYPIIFLVLYIIKVIQIIKRLHDTNLSGWYSVISLIPFINILFVLFLFFVDGTKGQNKYGSDPRGRIPEVKSQNYSNIKTNPSSTVNLDINQIDKKLNLIEDSFQYGLFTKEEYDSKKETFELQKKKIQKQKESLKAETANKEKLRQLFDNGIISKEEFNSKLSQLNNGINEYSHDINELKLDSSLVYISRGKQYGPISAKKIIRLLKLGEINPNCLVKHVNESTYSKRAKDLLVIKR